MLVSVIIPVYNAAEYVTDAVTSALAQGQVNELILVEDGSTDASLQVCRRLAAQDPRIRLVTHEGNRNLGAAASRNLGVRNATGQILAFLDADDTYLPGRFDLALEILRTYPDVDGVYETIGVRYHDEDLVQRHIERVGSENTGLRTLVSPEQLYNALATGEHGYVHIDGLVIRKRAMEGIPFDEVLTQSQDMDIMLRLAASRRLFPGDLTRVVALRGVHAGNRVFNNERARKFKTMYLGKAIRNGFYSCGSRRARFHIVFRFVRLRYGLPRDYGSAVNVLRLAFLVSAYLAMHPQVLWQIVNAPSDSGSHWDERILTYGKA